MTLRVSVARAASEPHDIDLLFVVNSQSVKETLRDQLAESSGAVEERYRLSICPVFLTEDELRARSEQSFVPNVLREGVLLSGKPAGLLRSVRRWERTPASAA